MAIRFYDEALANKIKRWVRNPDMKILKPDETTRLFQTLADTNNDSPITLPLITISREREVELLNTSKQPKTFDGFTIDKNEKVAIKLNVVPIQISYQIDIYTTNIEEADEYVREFIFKLINEPMLMVDICYNDSHILHRSSLWVESTISDNSDISERLFPTQFTRFTIKVVCDNAYLFSVPVMKNVIIETIGLETMEYDTKETEDQGTIEGESNDIST